MQVCLRPARTSREAWREPVCTEAEKTALSAQASLESVMASGTICRVAASNDVPEQLFGLGGGFDTQHDREQIATTAKGVHRFRAIAGGGGVNLFNSMGNAWTADYLKVTGELDVDLRSNIAAEARAKIVCR